MAGGAGSAGGAPGSAMSQINNMTIANARQPADGNIMQKIFSQGRDPAEMAASRASWMNAAMGIPNGAQQPQQPMYGSIADQTAALQLQQRTQQAQPQAQRPMPVFNMPAISPMQQYMQSLGINRMSYNPQAMASQSYAAARAPQNFKPAVMPNNPSAGTAANDPAKPTDYQRMRDELDQLRAWQANYTGNQSNDGGGYR